MAIPMQLMIGAKPWLHMGLAGVDGYDGYSSYGYVFSDQSAPPSPDGTYTTYTGPAPTDFYYFSGDATYIFFASDLNGTGDIEVMVGSSGWVLFTRQAAGNYKNLGDPFLLSGDGITDNYATFIRAA